MRRRRSNHSPNAATAQNQANGQQGRRSGGQQNQPKAAKQTKPKGSFWGDPTAEVPPPQLVAPASEPAAVVRSLGPPPLGAHDKVAEHYFTAVYDKAVGLASALAAAGGLLATGDEDEESANN